MKTKLVICPSKDEVLHGVVLISEYYKTYDPEDGHKIFCTNRRVIYSLLNYGPEGIKPAEEREVIFVMEGDPSLDSLRSTKHIDSELSISRITRGRNSRDVCERLINWLLCKDISSAKNTKPVIGDNLTGGAI